MVCLYLGVVLSLFEERYEGKYRSCLAKIGIGTVFARAVGYGLDSGMLDEITAN